MSVFKISVFILSYFFARIAFSACEPYSRSGSNLTICFDEASKVLISERCLKTNCDAKKFLSQHKSHKTQVSDSIDPVKTCSELQLPSVTMTDPKGKSLPFCLFNDGSVLEASVVEKLVN